MKPGDKQGEMTATLTLREFPKAAAAISIGASPFILVRADRVVEQSDTILFA